MQQRLQLPNLGRVPCLGEELFQPSLGCVIAAGCDFFESGHAIADEVLVRGTVKQIHKRLEFHLSRLWAAKTFFSTSKAELLSAGCPRVNSGLVPMAKDVFAVAIHSKESDEKRRTHDVVFRCDVTENPAADAETEALLMALHHKGKDRFERRLRQIE